MIYKLEHFCWFGLKEVEWFSLTSSAYVDEDLLLAIIWKYFCFLYNKKDHISGVNFINILLERFSYKSKLRRFSLITFGFVKFWPQNIGAKCASKMLMKLRPGVDFINALHTAFTNVGPKSAKQHCWLDYLFCAFGICMRKSCM